MSKKALSEQQERLLPMFRDICRLGQAEEEPVNEDQFLKRFLPIRSHFRVLDSDVRIIIGDKGSGKTHLFRALEIQRGREALVSLAREKGLPTPPLEKTTWLVGYHTTGKDFPPGGVIGAFARGKDTSVLQNFWLSDISAPHLIQYFILNLSATLERIIPLNRSFFTPLFLPGQSNAEQPVDLAMNNICSQFCYLPSLDGITVICDASCSFNLFGLCNDPFLWD